MLQYGYALCYLVGESATSVCSDEALDSVVVGAAGGACPPVIVTRRTYNVPFSFLLFSAPRSTWDTVLSRVFKKSKMFLISFLLPGTLQPTKHSLDVCSPPPLFINIRNDI